MLVGMTIPVVFFNLGFLWYFKHIKHRREGERETNIELAASESFKDVHHLDTDAARPPCFDLSSFVKKIALLSQFEHGKIARYYGADKLEMTWCVLPVKLAVTLHQSWSTLMIIANWNFLKGERKLEDIPIIRDLPEVFLEDLSGFPPVMIDNFPG
ncbi:hypothetical protein Tco_1485862 [Tanacetum coccineum]